MLVSRALPPLKTSPAGSSLLADAAKISAFDDGGNYISPSSSTLVPKIASVEDPNAVLADYSPVR